MKLNLLESREPEYPMRTSGLDRMRALLRCLTDSDEQYKHWPPLFGTESYWRWQLIKIRPLKNLLDATNSQSAPSSVRTPSRSISSRQGALSYLAVRRGRG